jgi:hypothetical protein
MRADRVLDHGGITGVIHLDASRLCSGAGVFHRESKWPARPGSVE